MPERLYQGQFDETLEPIKHKDVTPPGFSGLYFPHRRAEIIRSAETSPLELGRFVREVSARVCVNDPKVAATYLMENIFTPFADFDQEELWALLLDNKNNITHEAMIYRGTVNNAVIRIGELFKEAVRINAVCLLLAHCHPSGDAEPSPQDIQVTQKAIEAGELLDIELLDHLIIGREKWVSLKTRGLGFTS